MGNSAHSYPPGRSLLCKLPCHCVLKSTCMHLTEGPWQCYRGARISASPTRQSSGLPAGPSGLGTLPFLLKEMAVLTPPGFSYSPGDELEPTLWGFGPHRRHHNFFLYLRQTTALFPHRCDPVSAHYPPSFVLTYSWDMSCGSFGATAGISAGEDSQLLFTCNLPLRCLPVHSMGYSSHTLLSTGSCRSCVLVL